MYCRSADYFKIKERKNKRKKNKTLNKKKKHNEQVIEQKRATIIRRGTAKFPGLNDKIHWEEKYKNKAHFAQFLVPIEEEEIENAKAKKGSQV